MSQFYKLEFETPVVEVDKQIETLEKELVALPAATPATERSHGPLTQRVEELKQLRLTRLKEVYTSLSAWETVRVARHPSRPQTRDYLQLITRDFCELHGDRRFGDDPAMVTGFARIGPHRVLIVGHQKGKTTAEKLSCHFGCAHPEGYRKALAKMKLAEKFRLPVVTLVDTPGAYPGLGAEARGQAEAIATNLREMARLRTPIVSVVIGEGGSGGALGIAVADRVAMMEHAWYSVISPEGCAAILWKQANEQTNTAAATALRLTARDNLSLGIIDAIVPEPLGGAHRDQALAAQSLAVWVSRTLVELAALPTDELVARRYERFRRMGKFTEAGDER